MKKTLIATACTVFIAGNTLAADIPDPQIVEAQAVIKNFFAKLKGKLETAIQEEGLVHAVTVCKVIAPALAEEASVQSGWKVKRTSLKLRHPELNQPDAWERQVLEQFEMRKARGENVAAIDYSEVVNQNGQQTLRYMKAIPIQELCLNCHGSAIKPEVAAALDELYPGDQARGFNLGDIRGAFTLSKPF